MQNLNKKTNYLIVFLLISSFFFVGCSNIIKDMDPNRPINAEEKRRRNIEEGRGVGLGNLTKGLGKTNYEFSTSNPMWRASLETLDFIPLSTVDYSGGMIITDWYNDNNSIDESLKISVRFMSNEIRADSLKIIVHKKKCKQSINCNVVLLPNNSKLKSELLSVILTRAATLEKEAKDKSKKKKK